MNPNQILLWVIFVTLVRFGYAEDSCRFYEEELAVNQTWASCKELCAQKNGSCLAWGHNMKTNRCVGWMLERPSETIENDISSSDDTKEAEGSVVAQVKEKENSEDNDASASSPSQGSSFYADKDDLEGEDTDSSIERNYSAFYSTSTSGEEEDSLKDANRGTSRFLKGDHSDDEDEDVESTAVSYYADFYNTPTGSGGGKSDEGNSTYLSYDDFDYTTTTYGEEEESDDDDVESTAVSYYVSFYNTPTGSGATEDDDDYGGTSSSTYGGYSSQENGYLDYNGGSSSSSSSSSSFNMTSSVAPRQESDADVSALIEKYDSFYRARGPLYHECDVVATFNFTTPFDSVNNTMSSCFFQKVELGWSIPRESCIDACRNLRRGVSANCIGWMWLAKLDVCVVLVRTTNSSYTFCGVP